MQISKCGGQEERRFMITWTLKDISQVFDIEVLIDTHTQTVNGLVLSNITVNSLVEECTGEI